MEDVGDGMEWICSGERPGPVTVVERRGTLRRTVGFPGETESREEETGSTDKRVFNSDVPNMCNKDFEEKKGFDQAEERLDKLEGRLVE